MRRIDRAGLVYDPHYYLPLYFTGLYPWLYGGAIPSNVHYPNTDGSLVDNIVVTSTVHDATVPAGTYDWQTVTGRIRSRPTPSSPTSRCSRTVTAPRPCTSTTSSHRWMGLIFQVIPNGSFETKADVTWTPRTGSRTWPRAPSPGRESAAEGQWSVKTPAAAAGATKHDPQGTDASGQSIYFGTESGVKVRNGRSLALR
jgi:hypothetical protein